MVVPRDVDENTGVRCRSCRHADNSDVENDDSQACKPHYRIERPLGDAVQEEQNPESDM